MGNWLVVSFQYRNSQALINGLFATDFAAEVLDGKSPIDGVFDVYNMQTDTLDSMSWKSWLGSISQV